MLDSLLAFGCLLLIAADMVMIFLFIFLKLHRAQRMAINQKPINTARRHWHSAYILLKVTHESLIRLRPNPCGGARYSLGQEPYGDSLSRFCAPAIRLYMPALSEEGIELMPQQECLWEPLHRLMIFLARSL